MSVRRAKSQGPQSVRYLRLRSRDNATEAYLSHRHFFPHAAIALRIGNKTVSHFLRNKLEKQGGWDDLFSDKEWFKYLRLGGSFGNVSDLKRNQDSHWGLRLKAWAEEYLEKHEEVSLEEVFVFCNIPSDEEKEELVAGRKAFKAYLSEAIFNQRDRFTDDVQFT